MFLCNVGGAGGVAYGWGAVGLLNFEGAFIGFLLVLLTGYQKLKNALQNPTQKIPSKFVLGMELGLSWGKIGAYMLLLGALLALMRFGLFVPLPYLLGLGVCLGSALGLCLLKKP
ncbi:hypothetical protein [Helicobacter labacensis]|uniref:hypothetical protein n=1 Tax=Helicobacter labacensis TaxID=2316079 RepID=UPI001F420F11|nr:hypothetical protein [Helicobacter labacensis]